jgi:uncharacterized membrane protein
MGRFIGGQPVALISFAPDMEFLLWERMRARSVPSFPQKLKASQVFEKPQKRERGRAKAIALSV